MTDLVVVEEEEEEEGRTPESAMRSEEDLLPDTRLDSLALDLDGRSVPGVGDSNTLPEASSMSMVSSEDACGTDAVSLLAIFLAFVRVRVLLSLSSLADAALLLLFALVSMDTSPA